MSDDDVIGLCDEADTVHAEPPKPRRVNKPMTKTCDLCEEEFTTMSGNGRYCKTCAVVMKKAWGASCNGTFSSRAERSAFVREVALRMIMEEDEVEGADETHRCLYCGKVTSCASGYCRACRADGLDSVHKVTGRTNGWDAKATRKPHVEDGWRGRPCAGFGSAKERNHDR